MREGLESCRLKPGTPPKGAAEVPGHCCSCSGGGGGPGWRRDFRSFSNLLRTITSSPVLQPQPDPRCHPKRLLPTPQPSACQDLRSIPAKEVGSLPLFPLPSPLSRLAPGSHSAPTSPTHLPSTLARQIFPKCKPEYFFPPLSISGSLGSQRILPKLQMSGSPQPPSPPSSSGSELQPFASSLQPGHLCVPPAAASACMFFPLLEWCLPFFVSPVSA